MHENALQFTDNDQWNVMKYSLLLVHLYVLHFTESVQYSENLWYLYAL